MEPIYIVIERFEDIEDGRARYHPGDVFPRAGAPKPSDTRLRQLYTNENKRGKRLILELGDEAKEQLAQAFSQVLEPSVEDAPSDSSAEDAPLEPSDEEVEKPKRGGKKAGAKKAEAEVADGGLAPAT